jgi:hypothetical protein
MPGDRPRQSFDNHRRAKLHPLSSFRCFNS